MANVLVTGGSGFIGSHLCEALVGRGDDVTCLVRRTSRAERLQRLGVQIVVGDVTDPEAVDAAVTGKDVIYHLAGCARTLHQEDLYRVNAGGVANVARACALQSDPPTLVVVSSLAAAGPTRGTNALTEADPPLPVSHYGRSKLAGEAAARAWSRQVPTTIVRPPVVFGARDPMSLYWFRLIARFGVHVVPGRQPRRYSLIHVADLVQLLILAAQRGRRLPPEGASEAAAGEGCYFADCGEHPTYADLGRMIAKALGCRVLVWRMPTPTVWTVAAVAEAVARIRRQPSYLSIEKIREVTAGSWICSSAKAADELGFAVAAPLEQRLRETADWYREARWL